MEPTHHRRSTPKTALHSASALLIALSFSLSAPAKANHPTPGQMAQVKQLAHQLESDATQAHRAAEQYAHHGDWQEQQAIRDLHQLEQSARHFHRQVETYYANPAHTEGDYRRLSADFARSQQSFYSLHAYNYVQYVFERMVQTMQSLRYFYQSNNGGGGGNWNGAQVKQIAHRVEEAATHAHRQAETESHHGGWAEQQALRALHQLEEAARHFHRQVEQYYQSPTHTDQDFRRLEQAFFSAEQSVPHAHFSQHVLRDYNRTRVQIEQLRRYYSPGNPYDPHWP